MAVTASPAINVGATTVWSVLLFVGCLFSHQSKVISKSNSQPQQVHISMGNVPNSMAVTWVTFTSTPVSLVVYGVSKPSKLAVGTSNVFVDGGSEHRHIYIHRALMKNLLPNQTYIYRVGSSFDWSNELTFKSLPAGSNWSPVIAILGDMGVENAKTLPDLQFKAKQFGYDAIIHVGDFAYDMDSDNARVGDEFMRIIEPIASRLPYMTCPGNHENAYNFSNYKARFTMPGGDGENQYFSFDIGPVHFISFSAEFYYYTKYGTHQIANQYRWLVNDLKKANEPENRAKRPWVVAFSHRPMYCSNLYSLDHCPIVDNIIRTGFPHINHNGQKVYRYGLEKLFYTAGVDLIIGAHEHSYERFWPVYNRTVCNGSIDSYRDPPAPVHFVSGSAGCKENLTPFMSGGEPWSARRFSTYSYTVLKVKSANELSVEQISVETNPPRQIDEFSIYKSKHGPGHYTCHQQMQSAQERVYEFNTKVMLTSIQASQLAKRTILKENGYL